MSNKMTVFCAAMLCCSCANIQVFNETKAVQHTAPSGNMTLEEALAKFPVSDEHTAFGNTLFIHAIDYKNKTLVSTSISGRTNDTIEFRSLVQNFDKSKQTEVYFSFRPIRVVGTKVNRLNNDNVEVTIPGIDSTSTIKDLRIEASNNETLLRYEGKLQTAYGNEIEFWAQSDPFPTVPTMATIAVMGYLSANLDKLLDFCSQRLEKMRSQCKKPKRAVPQHHYKKALFEGGNFSVGKDKIKDCEIICK